ncbi:unnamed protein product, partial [Ilex paraguariensis]
MSLIEMDDIANTLGYAPYIGFYYKLPGLDLDKGLVHMSSDEHVLDIGKNNHSVDGDHPINDYGIGDGVASESECSEYEDLVDSDYESEYDDMLYETCVDHEAEWTGLKSNSQKTT